MSARRGPSPGTYRPDWSWKPSRADKLAARSGQTKHQQDLAKTADYLRSIPKTDRDEMLSQFREELRALEAQDS